MMNWNQTLIRSSSVGYLMTEPVTKADKEAGVLSKTAQKHLIEVYIAEKYGRKRDIQTKQMKKGIEVEQDSIDLLSVYLKMPFSKNDKRFNNDFITKNAHIEDSVFTKIVLETKKSLETRIKCVKQKKEKQEKQEKKDPKCPTDKKVDSDCTNITGFLPEDISKANNLLPETLIGKLKRDPNIDKKLVEKIDRLTIFLLTLMPTHMIEKLNKDNVKSTGFSKLLTDEYNKRKPQKASARISGLMATANRVYSRTIDSKVVTEQILRELTIISGFYTLMKSQYDYQMDYYSRELKESEYKKIWKLIEKQEEYIKFMVPPETKDLANDIVKTEDITKMAINPITAAVSAGSPEIPNPVVDPNASQSK